MFTRKPCSSYRWMLYVLAIAMGVCGVYHWLAPFTPSLSSAQFLPNLSHGISTGSGARSQSESKSYLPESSAKLQRLPKALIIGFSKCGSAALRSFLSIHPEVVSPSAETRFFIDHYSKGLEWYKAQMPASTSDQLTIEKTPGYIKSVEALLRIRKFDPEIKLLVVVRNPVTRIKSQYAHAMAVRREAGTQVISFKDWINEKNLARRVHHVADYDSYIQQAFRIFPKHQFLIISAEDFQKDPFPVIKKAGSFLGLRRVVTEDVFVYNELKGFYCLNTTHPWYLSSLENKEVDRSTGCLIETKGRKHPDIDTDLMKEIVEASRPYVHRLFYLLQRQFDWQYF